MFKVILGSILGLFVLSLYAGNGNISTDVKSEASSPNIKMTRDSNIQAMSGNSNSSSGSNATMETKKSFYEYDNNGNIADKQYTDHVQTSNSENIGVQEKANTLAWEAKRKNQKIDDGEYDLSEQSKDIAIGGMKDGEHSIKMGKSTSFGSKDGTYDIGN